MSEAETPQEIWELTERCHAYFAPLIGGVITGFILEEDPRNAGVYWPIFTIEVNGQRVALTLADHEDGQEPGYAIVSPMIEAGPWWEDDAPPRRNARG